MEKMIILADVTCDLSQTIRKRFEICDYIKGHVHFSTGRDIAAALDWDEISREEFYKTLSNKSVEVTTAPPSPEEFYLTFKKYAEDGCKILSMSLSSKISSTYDAACLAAERVKNEYPEAEIYCFDSYKMTGALGLLVIHASLMKQEGRSFEEIISWLEANKHRVHQMGPIDDLLFVARRGRISKGKAVMGSFAGVKPMGDCNRDGYTTVLAKAKGIKKALAVTAQYVKRMATDIQNQYIVISHSDREEYAEMLKAMIQEEACPKEILVSDVFPASGANIGPGMIGVYFLGEELTEDLDKEKTTLQEIIESI